MWEKRGLREFSVSMQLFLFVSETEDRQSDSLSVSEMDEMRQYLYSIRFPLGLLSKWKKSAKPAWKVLMLLQDIYPRWWKCCWLEKKWQLCSSLSIDHIHIQFIILLVFPSALEITIGWMDLLVFITVNWRFRISDDANMYSGKMWWPFFTVFWHFIH